MIFFLKRLILFIILFIVGSLITGLCLNSILFKSIYSENVPKLSSDVHILFIGDSHAMCAFNDSIIVNSFNASRNSETYFQTYNKLNWILKANPQIKLIVLSYSPHNISLEQNKLILYGDRYFPLLDRHSRDIIEHAGANGLLPEDHGFLSTFYNIRHYIIYNFLMLKWDWGLPTSITPYLDYLIEPSYSDKKQYLHPLFTPRYSSIHSNLSSETTSTALRRHFGTEISECTESAIMIYYLNAMGNLCKNSKVNLLLVNTPMHSSYLKALPASLYKKYLSLADSLPLNNKFIEYADFSDSGFPDSDFGDADHLNNKGNLKFANICIDLLNKSY